MNILQYIEKNTDEYTRGKININDPIKNVKKNNKQTIDTVNGVIKSDDIKQLSLYYDDVQLWRDVSKEFIEEQRIDVDDHEFYSSSIDAVAIKNGICTYVQCNSNTDNIKITDLRNIMYFLLIHNKKSCVLCYSNDVCAYIKSCDSVQNENCIILKKIPFRKMQKE